MPVSGCVGEVGNGSRTQPLGIHRPARSPADAADEPLARAALDPHLDDRRDAHGRWLDLVRPGADAARLWRPTAFFSRWGGRIGGGIGYFCFQGTEKAEPAAEALPDRAALLVESAASRQVFVSIGAHDDGVFDRTRG